MKTGVGSNKWTSLAAPIGLLVPILCFSGQVVIRKFQIGCHPWTDALPSVRIRFGKLDHHDAVRWYRPTRPSRSSVFAVSLPFNVPIYAVTRLLLWIGAYRSRVMLVLTLSSVIVLRIFVLKL